MCQIVSIIAIPFHMVSPTLTSQGFTACTELTGLLGDSLPLTRSVPLLRSLHWLPIRFRTLFKINLLTSKTRCEKPCVYLHFMLAASLPAYSLRSSKGISLSVPRVKNGTGARAFYSCVPSLWTTCRCVSVQPFQFLPL